MRLSALRLPSLIWRRTFVPFVERLGRHAPRERTVMSAPRSGGGKIKSSTRHANRCRARSRAFRASASRLRDGLAVSSDANRRRATSATSSTARLNAASLLREGWAKPESLRTNCSAEARISSSVAGGSKLNSVRMLRHMDRVAPGSLRRALCRYYGGKLRPDRAVAKSGIDPRRPHDQIVFVRTLIHAGGAEFQRRAGPISGE